MTQLYSYALIVLAWVIFGILHSSLASGKIKEKAYKAGFSPLAYRRLYNVIAVILFILIILGAGFIQPEYFMPHGKSSQGVGLILATFGFFLTKMAFKQVSFASFIGWKEEEEKKLVKTGIYARIRHPLYTASILFLAGLVIFSPSYTNLIHSICLFIYVMIGIGYEEKRMIQNFGSEYEEYKERVPRLIPKFNSFKK